ncbi:MAG: type IV pilus biogenesis/stability protein PilW [Sterolibacterium sp.]|jgi:type IV pilus assembly protein PilF
MNAALFLTLAAILFLGGCAGNTRTAEAVGQPVSQQTASTDIRQRAKVHTELGTLYMQRGNMGVALEEARAALSADPAYAPAYNLQGLVYMQLRENQAAEKSFEKALAVAPTDPEINNSFGWFLCQTGQESRSLQHFLAAIKSPLYATPALPFTNAGICSMRIKDDKAAEDYFVKALRVDGHSDRALYFLADIAYRQGRIAAARLHLQELYKITEPSPESLWLGVRIERKLGDREAEARLASQLRRRFPGSQEQQMLMQGQYD